LTLARLNEVSEEIAALLKQLKEKCPTLVDEVVPGQIKPGELQKVLQTLLRERVPIRDLETILETLGEWALKTKDLDVLSEAVRTGATAAMPAICSPIIVASFSVKCGTPADGAREPNPAPGRKVSRLLPRLEICAFTASVAPWPSVTIVMMAATPMKMPSTVRNARVRLRPISRTAMESAFQIMTSVG